MSSRSTPDRASARPTSSSFPYATAVSTWRYPAASASATVSSVSPGSTSKTPIAIVGTATPRTVLVTGAGTPTKRRCAGREPLGAQRAAGGMTSFGRPLPAEAALAVLGIAPGHAVAADVAALAACAHVDR